MGVHDSHDLALSDWMGSAQFDREEDLWPRRWAEAYVDFAAGEKRSWLRGWATGSSRWSDGPSVVTVERTATGTRSRASTSRGGRARAWWGRSSSGCGRTRRAVASGWPSGIAWTTWSWRADRSPASAGRCWRPTTMDRGKASNRDETGDFVLTAQAVIVSSGGIGGDHDLVRKAWPQRLGTPPSFMVSGVPAHVDGRMIGISRSAGAEVINEDRMWHYVEGLRNWDPIWDNHGIRILPGPSSMWFDAAGRRLPAPYLPGFDTLGTLRHPPRDGLRLLVVRADAEDHREGVRPLRLRTEPGPHRQGREAAPRPGRRRRGARAGRGVQGARRGLRRRRHPRPSWCAG